MTVPERLRHVLRDRELASLGDAYVNFIYSLALTEVGGRPKAVKVSDRILADAFRSAGLRELLGTRVTRKDMANAAEALLIEAYRNGLLTIQDSVKTMSQNPEGPKAGLADLLRLGAGRLLSS